jgi:hypothetical protein
VHSVLQFCYGQRSSQLITWQGLHRENPAVPELPPSRAGLDLASTLERIQQSFLISDPLLPDCPIVFASDNFIEFTGCAGCVLTRRTCAASDSRHGRRYTREEVLGRNWCVPTLTHLQPQSVARSLSFLLHPAYIYLHHMSVT